MRKYILESLVSFPFILVIVVVAAVVNPPLWLLAKALIGGPLFIAFIVLRIDAPVADAMDVILVIALASMLWLPTVALRLTMLFGWRAYKKRLQPA